ncbi:hypothetical protein D9M70_592420 [compost metagenome]
MDERKILRCVTACAYPATHLGLSVSSSSVRAVRRLVRMELTITYRVYVVFRIGPHVSDQRLARATELFLADFQRVCQTLRLKVVSVYVDQFRQKPCES